MSSGSGDAIRRGAFVMLGGAALALVVVVGAIALAVWLSHHL